MIQFDSMIRFEDMAAWSGRNFAAAEFELHFRVFGAFLARARVYRAGLATENSSMRHINFTFHKDVITINLN